MHRLVLPILASLVAATAAGCGSTGPSGGIPEARADSLRREIQDVREAVEGARCDDVSGQLTQVDERVDNLPQSVDDGLLRSLRDGVDRLRSVAQQDCTEQGLQEEEVPTPESQPTEPPAETQTDTTPTEPPDETQTDTTPTEPPDDTETDTTPTEPPAEAPPDTGQAEPPPADSGGNAGGEEGEG